MRRRGRALGRGFRGAAIGLALALHGAWALAAPPGDAASTEGPPADEAALKQAARAEVQAGSAAFGAGDFQLAIDHYEAAMKLLPAPKLHYNIGVCHQRLALAAETPEARTRQRDLAIESYNAYLEQNPRADDRLEIAETIRELGGSPVTMPRLKPLFDDSEPDGGEPGDGEPGDGAPHDGAPHDGEPGDGEPGDPPPQETTLPYPHHGQFGIALVGGYSPTMAQAVAVDAPGMFAIDLHGGGFLGRRRRFLLAAHTLLYSGAVLRTDGLAFYGYSLGLVGQQTWVVSREALQLRFGGVAALTGQTLTERADAPAPVCSLDRNGVAATRTGFLGAPRFNLGILLGPRRRGIIDVLVQPSVAVFGDGPGATACQADETPWTALGIRRRWQFQLWVGAGFSFRF